MQKKKLCPICKTGLNTYMLDKQSTQCPYMTLHNGKKCPMFVKLKKESS